MKEQNLFINLVSQNKFWNAQLVGKNLLCKDPANQNTFEAYFDFCIKICRLPIEIETRTFYLKEAELSLSVFCERAEISESVLKVIEVKRQNLVEASRIINETIQDEISKQNKEIESVNQVCLRKLVQLKGEFLKCTNQKEFDRLIMQMSEIEKSFDKESFSDTQQLQYDALTKDFSDLVSKSMARIVRESDIEYNRKAAESFKSAFDMFKNRPELYTANDSKLYELVAKYLFAFDAKRLFNETLVYYNHVYTYIFNKLDDDGKFRFTQFSFDTPKI